MQRRLFLAALLASISLPILTQAAPALRPAQVPGLPDLFVWTDTANVYVLREGDAAILFDLGDGSVLDHLAEIGVRKVEWVLFSHHHREQLQGHPRLRGLGAQIGAPEAERALFENPGNFRKLKPRLSDRYTVHGASYVRPPVEPLKIDRGFTKTDELMWRGHSIRVIETAGNSPGSVSYLLERNSRWIAISGDLMLNDARLHTWFDSEWDYSFGAGIYALHNAVALLRTYDPIRMLPSHGPIIVNPSQQLEMFQKKLRNLERLVLRGYPVSTFSADAQDRFSRPTSIPQIGKISPHLYKLKGPNFFQNFALILADSGHGLLVDAGLMDAKFLDDTIDLLKSRLGLTKIDAVLVSHMHGDHFLNAPQLQKKHGTQVWALDKIADKMQFPERFDYAASVQSYGAGFDSVRPDRIFKSGESFDWEGFHFTVDWMPGQTEFAMCLQGMIDGRKVAFTGDHIFADATDPKQSGHEAIVARNSGILEEGYIFGADYLLKLKPDMLVGGHSFVMDKPAALIGRYKRWAVEMRDAFQTLSPDPDYRYWFDPFWVRAEPYRVPLEAGKSSEVMIHVRNFRKRGQQHKIVIHAPPGFTVEPAVLEGSLPAEGRAAFPIRIQATGKISPAAPAIVALDVSLDGQRYGELFDFMVDVPISKDPI